MNENVTQFLPTRFALHLTTLKLLNRRWDNVVIGASADRPEMAGQHRVEPGVGLCRRGRRARPRESPGALQARFAQVVIPREIGQRPRRTDDPRPPAQHAVDRSDRERTDRARTATIGRLEVDAHNYVEERRAGLAARQADIDATPRATLTRAPPNWRTLDAGLGNGADEATPRRTVFDFKLDVSRTPARCSTASACRAR